MPDQLHEQVKALAALKNHVTAERLDDEGRYFAEGYGDLTQCTHGETGNYRNRPDGKAVAILWNLWKAGALDQLITVPNDAASEDDGSGLWTIDDDGSAPVTTGGTNHG